MGVAPERIYVDHGLTGTNRARPGLREAMAACRAGDVLVVTAPVVRVSDRHQRSRPRTSKYQKHQRNEAHSRNDGQTLDRRADKRRAHAGQHYTPGPDH
jgi:hypothetical protein